VVALLVIALGAASFAHGGTRAAQPAASGSPDRGRQVFLEKGCLGCHALGDPGTRTPVGPALTAELMRSSSAAAGKSLGEFAVESVLVPNAFVSPGYVSNLMPPTKGLSRQQLDDLVSFLIGRPYASPSPSVELPARPIAACKADAGCRATVTRWARQAALPAVALDGARIVAKSGCLSCHRYAGSGTSSGPAPELTRVGLSGLSEGRLLKKLECPGCLVNGSGMPSFKALGKDNLRKVVQFLRASKGQRP